jgi:hypothetical protein
MVLCSSTNPFFSRHEVCTHCGQCHNDQCANWRSPCLQSHVFTVCEQENGMFHVRSVDPKSTAVSIWANEHGERVVTQTPFISYREFLRFNNDAVFVAPDVFEQLIVLRRYMILHGYH